MASIKIDWQENVVKNLSKFPAIVVSILVMQSQLSQAKIANAAKANHGANAHSEDRYVSRTGILSQSIIPGPVTVTPTGVEFSVIANASYAGYVEGDRSVKSTKVGVYPFLRPAARNELPFFIARLRTAMEGVRF